MLVSPNVIVKRFSAIQCHLGLYLNVSEHNLSFSVTLLLQWQKALAGSPPRMQCSSCVTCKRSSDPTSSSSPTSSAMLPDYSRLEIYSTTQLSQSLSVIPVKLSINNFSPPSHRPVVSWTSPPFWQSSTLKVWVPQYQSWEHQTWQLMLKHPSPWWSRRWRRSWRPWGTPNRLYCVG